MKERRRTSTNTKIGVWPTTKDKFDAIARVTARNVTTVADRAADALALQEGIELPRPEADKRRRGKRTAA